MAKIVLVPTSHIAAESVRRVRETVEKEKPDCIAVEMDLNRFYSIRNEQASGSSLDSIRALGFTTFFVYFLMKKLQEWLGKKVGILPGSEMLEAVKIGESKGLTIAFIDQDIRLTFARMKMVGNIEMLKLIWFFIKGVTVGFLLSKVKKGEAIDLRKLPPNKLIKEVLSVFRKEFPGIYRVLITERDRHMAHKLKDISPRFKKIVAVVGAGHEDGMKKLLKSF